MSVSKQSGWKRPALALAASIITLLLGVGVYVADLLATDNFHAVDPGELYRSGQMNPETLKNTIRRWGIQCVFNLRGDGNSDWYRGETNVLESMGVPHHDFALSAGRRLGVAEMDSIVQALKAAPKPILIHCNGGADRSALVSALYCYSILEEPASQADRQLTPFYGHIPYFHWRYSVAMDESFALYVQAHPHSNAVQNDPSPGH